MRTNDNAYQAIFNAAQIISMDARISEWLGDNDPHALKQLRGALKVVQDEIDTSVALRAMAEKFASIQDMTFLNIEEQAAMMKLLSKVSETLMLRGMSRLSQKLGADVGKLMSEYSKIARGGVK